MAIMDYFNEFSDAQAVTSTAISTNVIDLARRPTTPRATSAPASRCISSSARTPRRPTADPMPR